MRYDLLRFGIETSYHTILYNYLGNNQISFKLGCRGITSQNNQTSVDAVGGLATIGSNVQTRLADDGGESYKSRIDACTVIILARSLEEVSLGNVVC